MNTNKPIVKAAFAACIVSATFILSACGDGEKKESASETKDTTATQNAAATVDQATAALGATTGDTTVNGTVHFVKQADGNVKMNLEITVEKMANKSVAIHIHEHADCGEHGNHAGGHWNPTGENHGKWGEGSFHSGDFGNISLDASGKGTLEIISDRWTLGGNANTNVINKTIVIHSGVDDMKTQPSGNSGSRIGCGIIQ